MAKEIFATQSLIPIQEIKRGVIVLKDGALRSVLEVSAVNFLLKSTEEQSIILENWKQLLNDLDFPLEIITRSYRINLKPYLNFLRERIDQEKNELLKIQEEDYLSFLNALIKENSIMKKKFYIVVPYNPVVMKSNTLWENFKTVLSGIINLRRTSISGTTILSPEEFEQYYQQLMIRRSMIISSLTRIGLTARPLETKELIALFFNLYNPQNGNTEKLTVPERKTF